MLKRNKMRENAAKEKKMGEEKIMRYHVPKEMNVKDF